MKKVETRYVFDTLNAMFADHVELEVNEEAPQYIRIKTMQDVRRTKTEYIEMYKQIIKELKDFTY
jgi:hypothetical protein